MMRKFLLPLSLVAVILVAVGAVFLLPRMSMFSKTPIANPSPTPQVPSITSFDECVAAGYPVQESLPERCVTPEGVSFERPSPTELLEMSGTVVCLPKKDQRGPQTLECAIGLQGSDGAYYGLIGENGQAPTNLTMQSKITISGKLIPLNPQARLPFDIDGVIQVMSVK